MSLSTVLDEKVKTSPCSPWPMMGGTPGCRLMTEEHDGSFTHTSMFLCHSRFDQAIAPQSPEFASSICLWFDHIFSIPLYTTFTHLLNGLYFIQHHLKQELFHLTATYLWKPICDDWFMCVCFYFIYSVSEIFVMLKNEAFANPMLFRWQCMLEQNLTTLFLVNCIRLD